MYPPPSEFNPDNASSAKHQRVEALFHQALDLAPATRAAFLDQACGDDRNLRQFVEQLLASSAEADNKAGWGEPALHRIARTIAQSSDPTLDRYSLLEQIGTGGMGVVYRAIRSDDTYFKEVAIKFVPWAASDENIVHRFRTERQILASLEHPNIARLLDGGETVDGSPFLVMEFVKGLPIDQYVAERKPPLRVLLPVFRRICAAVGYAHRNLIVHRDLKPGNILVMDGPDGTAEPKLLDFGIARLLDDSEQRTRTRTMTIEYASPEQVSGAPIGVASDIYSLGVLLYELVGGSLPYRPTANSMDLAQAILKEDPLPLSTSIDADLANIIGMALRREPERRYKSAEEFAEDLRRFEDGYPVLAQPDTSSYRARKFVGRNKLALAAAALVLLTLAGGAFTTLRQARIANRRFNDVRKLANSLIYELYDSIKLLPGATNARKLMVNRALEYLDALNKERLDDRDLTRDLAEAYLRIGYVQGLPDHPNLGDVDGALANFRKSLALDEELVAADPNDLVASQNAGENHIALCKILMLQGDLKSSREHGLAAVAILERIAPSRPAVRYILAGAYVALGNVEGNPNFPNLGNTRMTLDLYQKGLEEQRKVSDAKPGDSIESSRLANAYANLGQMQLALNDGPRAVENYRRALEIQERVVNHDPSNALAKQDLATSCNNLAVVYARNLNDTQSARPMIDRAIKMRGELVQSDPNNVDGMLALAASYFALSIVRRDEPAESLAACDRGIAIYDVAKKNSSGGKLSPVVRRSLYKTRADALIKLRRFPEAVGSAQTELEIDDGLLKVNANDASSQSNQGIAYLQIGRIHAGLGEWREARKWYQRSLDIFDGMRKSGKPIAQFQVNLEAAQSALTECDRKLGAVPQRP